MKNWSLLIQTAERIIKCPEDWDQRIWVATCGTTACFAGWATRLYGCWPVNVHDVIVQRVMAHSGNPSHAEFVCVPEDLRKDLPVKFWTRDPAARSSGIAHIRDAAMAALWINTLDAEDLFHPDNELGDILDIITAWARQDGIILPTSLYPDTVGAR